MNAGSRAGAIAKDYEDWVKIPGLRQIHALRAMPFYWNDGGGASLDGINFQLQTAGENDFPGYSILYDYDFGLRWENGVIVKERGVEQLSSKFMKVIEIKEQLFL